MNYTYKYASPVSTDIDQHASAALPHTGTDFNRTAWTLAWSCRAGRRGGGNPALTSHSPFFPPLPRHFGHAGLLPSPSSQYPCSGRI